MAPLPSSSPPGHRDLPFERQAHPIKLCNFLAMDIAASMQNTIMNMRAADLFPLKNSFIAVQLFNKVLWEKLLAIVVF
jgi:hypothetical protein